MAVALAGCTASYALWQQQQGLAMTIAQTRFEQDARSFADALERRIAAHADLLHGLRSLFTVNPRLRRSDFERAASELGMAERHPSVKNVHFTRYVPGPQRAAFEARTRADVHMDASVPRDFTIHPPQVRSDYYVVDYVWPQAGNDGVQGLEIHSQPANLDALLRARDTGALVASAPFDLEQERELRTGFTLRVPVYARTHAAPAGKPESPRFLGAVGVSLRVHDLISALRSDGHGARLSLAMADVGLADAQASAYPLLATADAPAAGGMRRTYYIQVAGRHWKLDFQSAASYLSPQESRLPWLLGAGGLFVTALLTALVSVLGLRRVQAQDRAEVADTALHESKERFQEEIHYLAYNDPLTGLPNRRLLRERLQMALAGSARTRHCGAVLMLDLDNFKTLNETRGHDVGDRLLAEVAGRLRGCLGEDDTLARHGGDEFVAVLKDLGPCPQQAAIRAEETGQKILAALREPFHVDADGSEPYHTTLSVGVALFEGQGVPADELLKRGELAMYEAKAAGRNAVRLYDPQMQAVVAARAELEADMRAGLESGQFELFYQPKVVHGRIRGAEALLRWRHPARGFVPPSEFIPLAEECGLILRMGEWVLQTACEQLARWSGHPVLGQLTLAVNVSPRQFHQAGFVAQVLAALAGTGAEPHRLRLELTESMLLQDVEDTIDKMVQLRGYGVGFSLDDFGTGYSSLAYLKRLPLQELKIDQSFVRDVLTDPNDAAIARTIVALGTSLGLQVTAEGVETEAQRAFLERSGCHAWQGYLISRPVPVADYESLALEHERRYLAA